MNSYNGPAVWDKLLKTVTSSAYPKAVVAGGAVRDWFHDESITPRDIDVFVAVDNEFEFDIAYHGLPWRKKKQLTAADSASYTVADSEEFTSNILGGVIEIIDYDDNLKINIIGKRSEAIEDVPGGLLSDFDHTLCEFWWDGEKVCRSQDAYAAFQSKRIEIKPHAVGKERTRQRLKSLTSRSAYKAYDYDGKSSAFFEDKTAKAVDYAANDARILENIRQLAAQHAARVGAQRAQWNAPANHWIQMPAGNNHRVQRNDVGLWHVEF